MKKIGRRSFIGSSMGALGLISIGVTGTDRSYHKFNQSDEPGRVVRLKGRSDSKTTHWDIITIGNLSRNRYWGESDERAFRNAICTCTVISGEDFHLMVDPSLAEEEAMIIELKRRTGLTPDDIDTVFVTHHHGDHLAGLRHFQKANWLAGSEVAFELNKSGQYPKRIQPAGNTLYGVIDVIPLPGHTPDHMGIRFDYRGLSVVVAGDSVATKDFWDDRRMYYNAIDPVESKQTMEKIDAMADIIVPGHDNSFFNL